ncbi:zinc-binding alcohol dehydrogenase family protein [Paenibacillus allorhizosphaerae]|uniref:2-haloacrylate reductase n=1 Tax=Paenibacillus allorhizosphaerae TaxID=2849866 RepID=A0ABN7TY29_9BACL|nr:zinc-binding dehydrogenase [Paenibacillus allorhizosphaerae]CAG7657128.1 2-haloacrylate reductase [Paenibacillus allorhizosphaerae]
MKAIVIEQAGGTEQLLLKELPDLIPGRGQLTIDVAHAGVGYVDVLLRKGSFGGIFPFPATPGLEVAGYVRAIGDGVEGFYIGQPVAALTLLDLGGYSTMANIKADLTVPLDELGAELDLATAAAAIVNLTTAYMAVRQISNMKEGDHILVHGAAGGLGSFIGQIAKRFGASKVLGTVGTVEKTALAESLGYDELFVRSEFMERTRQATEQKGVHIVFDTVGGHTRKQSMDLLRPLGQIVALGETSGEDVLHSSNELWVSNKAVVGFSIGGYALSHPKEVRQAAKEALRLLASREICTEVFGIYPLEKAAETHVQLEGRKTVGKLVLDCRI